MAGETEQEDSRVSFADVVASSLVVFLGVGLSCTSYGAGFSAIEGKVDKISCCEVSSTSLIFEVTTLLCVCNAGAEEGP